MKAESTPPSPQAAAVEAARSAHRTAENTPSTQTVVAAGQAAVMASMMRRG